MSTIGNRIMPDTAVSQHSLSKSILLHLLPGVLILVFFVIAAPLAKRVGVHSMIGYTLAVFFVQIPFELGLLYYLGKKRNGRLSLQGIVLYREPMPVRYYILLAVPCILWLFVILYIVFAPLETYLTENVFSWLPGWFQQGRFVENPDQYPTSSLWLVLALLWIAAIPGPAVEELYFRGFLLPRISRFGRWSPLINTILFSLEHLATPWQSPGLIIAFLPTAYAVWWKKNLRLGIIVHCVVVALGFLFLTLGTVAAIFDLI
jgi:membrane protease YdiL (CAAX protease family)